MKTPKFKPDFSSLLIHSKPGNDLIAELIKNPTYINFVAYFNARVGWQEYPLVHDRMLTYSLFFDFEIQIPKNPDILSKYLDFAIQIAKTEKENNDRFYCALALITDISKRLVIYRTLNTIEAKNILSFEDLVEKYKELSNIECYWKQLLNMCT